MHKDKNRKNALKKRLEKESKLVSKNSMNILHQFEKPKTPRKAK